MPVLEVKGRCTICLSCLGRGMAGGMSTSHLLTETKGSHHVCRAIQVHNTLLGTNHLEDPRDVQTTTHSIAVLEIRPYIPRVEVI